MKKILFAFAAAAALSLSSQIAAAETVVFKLKAEVPVGFHTSNARLPQGSYGVRLMSLPGGAPLVRFTNRVTGRSIMAAATRSQVEARAAPAIHLSCFDRECDITSITVRKDVWTFARRNLSPEQTNRLYTLKIPFRHMTPTD